MFQLEFDESQSKTVDGERTRRTSLLVQRVTAALTKCPMYKGLIRENDVATHDGIVKAVM